MRLPSIGDVVDDKFRVERKLGEGGTSTIYEVRHAVTDKKFAIKWLSPELAQNDLAVELFIHEARVCGRFEHPNAVQIYDICQARDTYYMLMEFLEGESLEARLQSVQRFSAQAACDILLPCIEALSAAHRVGIVHQDLKPSNIFLCTIEGRAEEVPKVLDFGISNLSHNGHDLSPIAGTAHTVSGTPLYMAPEQMRGQTADPRIDIYALGVVLYELVAGEPPFDSDTFEDLVARIVESQPARLDEVVRVDPAFAEIVARAMAGDAEHRFATMDDFADALRPYGSQRPSVAVKPVEARRSDAPRRPVRTAWKTTRPGVVLRSEEDAESLESESASEPKLASRGALDPPSEPSADEAAAEGASVDEAESADVAADPDRDGASDTEDPTEIEPPASELSHDELAADAASAAESEPARESHTAPAAIAQPRAAFESGPRVPPITLPPPAAAGPAAADLRATDAFGDGTSIDEDAFVLRPRISRSRWIGVVVALGGALLLTWHSLSGEPSAPAPRSIPTPRPTLPESDTTALRDVPGTSDMSNRQSDERVYRAPPKPSQAPETVAKESDAPREKVARRANSKAHASKRTAASKDNAKPSKRQAATPDLNVRPERAASSEARSGISLPAAGLSRQDF
jgi:serine/threonine protein kinase